MKCGTLVPGLVLSMNFGLFFLSFHMSGLHHYRVPWPLCYLVFQGRFQTVQHGEEENFDKRKRL